eukprot:7391897-Prymnesium_polylepis.2
MRGPPPSRVTLSVVELSLCCGRGAGRPCVSASDHAFIQCAEIGAAHGAVLLDSRLPGLPRGAGLEPRGGLWVSALCGADSTT